MSEFDARAREWDKDKMHIERSAAIAAELERIIPLKPSMKALEYGAGTGILSFLLKDRFSEITLMDNSLEMIKVCAEKVDYFQSQHITPLFFNLEHQILDVKFDVIYNQMVLHHIVDYQAVIKIFYSLLNPAGYLAIADLYPEDGSFHGLGVNVHLGFDPEILTEILKSEGFKNVEYKTCFEIRRESGRSYPIFLIVANK